MITRTSIRERVDIRDLHRFDNLPTDINDEPIIPSGNPAESMSDAQCEMHNAVSERSKKRLADYETHLLRQFFDIRTLQEPTIIGSLCWSCKPVNQRWLFQPQARNFGGGWVTGADLARDYLAIKFNKRNARCTTREWQAAVGAKKQPPILAFPCQLERGVYLDLTGAYWQIVRAVGWNVIYVPSHSLIRGKSMLDFPYSQEKLARNCLVSVGLNGKMTLWTGEELKFISKPNQFINLVLWRLVQDVLNGVAWDMAHIDARYIYSDGYILPEQQLTNALDVLENWGVNATVKRIGSFIIRAPASYSVHSRTDGYYETGNFKRQARDIRMQKVYNPDVDFLRPRFKKYADYAQQEWEL